MHMLESSEEESRVPDMFLKHPEFSRCLGLKITFISLLFASCSYKQQLSKNTVNRPVGWGFLCKAINYRRLCRARKEFIGVTSPGTKITWHEQIEISYRHLLLFLQCCAIKDEIKQCPGEEGEGK